MRVLFLCHRFPYPADGGGKVRALNIVRHLAAQGHSVTLCSLTRSPLEESGIAEMQRYCARVETVAVRPWLQALRMLVRLVTSEPSTFGFFYSRRLANRVRSLLREQRWDLVFVHCSSMGSYIPADVAVPKVIDFADIDSQKWLDYRVQKPFPASLAFGWEGYKVREQERRLAQTFDVVTMISDNELRALRQFAGDGVGDWFPNGVDLSYFAPTARAYERNLICFVGRMDYYPNEKAMLWFCDAVWPRLRARYPDLVLRIVGARPPVSIVRLADLPGVEVTGFVPDVRPHVQSAALTIAPLMIARGMQNKILESLALGVPVVTTPLVASGLGLKVAGPLRLAATPEDYIAEVGRIVDDPEERARLATASRLLVERDFSWSSALKKLDGILRTVPQLNVGA